MSGLSQFHPLVRAWFERSFGRPTAVQKRAWPAIARGDDALIAAPTGSGKTLAAFLSCLDRLVREADAGALGERTRVVYVSPLKALSNDIHRNLERPIAEMAALAAELGLPVPNLRAMVRTGDTPEHARRQALRTPPHILVTTPESLFILLTSASGRAMLSGVRAVILDEIHAIAPDKRGAHLALSIERLDELVRAAGHPAPQRIGLSATVRPVEVAARLLVGTARPMPRIVDVGQRRDLDLAVEVPRDELGAVCTNDQWSELYDRFADLAREHRSTIVFVNTRRLVEKVAHQLAARLGPESVAAHHGSMSRARRHDAERRLKAGELRVIVATASLELGIDVGAVELVCVVGSPRSIATALQRIGRSGHALAKTPKGRIFPLTRDQLVECAAIVRAARRGTLDAIALREAPLDVLAQQLVAMCACEDRGEGELFDFVRRAAPYERLTARDYESVVTMLSEGIATRRGRSSALLHRDQVEGRLRARRGARLIAITSGGAIPDNASYDVVLEPEGTKIGTVDEDFAVESMSGEVFLLGNSSWRIRRIESGVMRVEDARGAAPSVPFWLGEAPARTKELSAEVAALREEIDRRLDERAENAAGRGAIATFLEEECALDRRGAELLRDYLAAGRAALGAMPTAETIVGERFFDEAGGMQLVLHAPFGGRINRAFGMALRKRFCRTFDFELQAAATDDGVLLSLGAQHSFPIESIFEMLRPESIEELLVQASIQAPMFGTRFRWNATRALALVRQRGGRRVPPPLLRMRADDLIAAVFPAQQGCQDNHGVTEKIVPPDHPLVNETLRDCLTEAMDAPGLREVLGKIASGAIRCVARETPEPSVFAHEILNANPYAFLDDAPLEERRARAVTVRRGLPADVADRIGGLSPEAIERVLEETRPVVRDADEAHDLLLDLVLLPTSHPLAQMASPWLDALATGRRAARIVAEGRAAWVAAERLSLAEAAWGSSRFEPKIAPPAGSRGSVAVAREEAIVELVRGWLAVLGPTTAANVAATLGLAVDDVEIALAALEGDGVVLRGRFSPQSSEGSALRPAGEAVRAPPPGLGPRPQTSRATDTEWCDRRLLARIHRRTVERLRADIEPASAAELLRFLFAWQHVNPKTRLHGREGLLRVVTALQGFELAAGAWEREVLPARVSDFAPELLDALCLSGEVVWGRLAPRETAGGAPSRAAPITLARRRELGWLLAPRDEGESGSLSHAAKDVLGYLRDNGASFTDEIIAGTRRLPCEVEEALWELVAAGWVTGDGFGGLRALLTPASRRSLGHRKRTNRFRRDGAPLIAAGRWALLKGPPAPRLTDADPSLEDESRVEQLARQYVRRYGVVLRELLTREPHAPAWRDLLRVYRRLEMRGELRGGRLVAGFVGEQFAAPEALDALRAIRREGARGEVVRVSSCDPLNLVGIVTPGGRVAAQLGTWVSYRDGVPVGDAVGARRDAG